MVEGQHWTLHGVINILMSSQGLSCFGSQLCVSWVYLNMLSSKNEVILSKILDQSRSDRPLFLFDSALSFVSRALLYLNVRSDSNRSFSALVSFLACTKIVSRTFTFQERLIFHNWPINCKFPSFARCSGLTAIWGHDLRGKHWIMLII